MSLAPSTFRSAAIKVGAAVALAASSFFPAYAETVTSKANPVGVNQAACDKYKNDPASHAQCEYDEMGRKIAAFKKDTADTNTAGLCTDFLIAGVKSGLFTKSAVLTAAKGKLTAGNACEAARSFGYGQKAELDRPAVR